MKRKLVKFLYDESGATAIEYSMIAALVSVAGLAALNVMGDSLITIFSWIGSLITNAAT